MDVSDVFDTLLQQLHLVLFGTDFCPPLNLVDIERFDRFLEELFSPQELQAIYYENPLRAFPRLADYLKEDR